MPELDGLVAIERGVSSAKMVPTKLRRELSELIEWLTGEIEIVGDYCGADADRNAA